MSIIVIDTNLKFNYFFYFKSFHRDLSGNQISHITTKTFSGLLSLTHLFLKGNHISTIENYSFRSSLNSLELM
jgi:hypothetical protein